MNIISKPMVFPVFNILESDFKGGDESLRKAIVREAVHYHDNTISDTEIDDLLGSIHSFMSSLSAGSEKSHYLVQLRNLYTCRVNIPHLLLSDDD